MRRAAAFLSVTATVAVAVAFTIRVTPAHADVPVIDSALLTQNAATSSATVKLAPVMTQRQTANQGVKCAVTIGKKASVADPTVAPQTGAGAQAIQSYAPSLSTTPVAGVQGAALNFQTLFQSAGTVVGAINASRSTLGVAQSGFSASGQQAGTGVTVMAAIDMNSAARLQNALAWNGVVGSANLWLTAINALNLARVSDASQVAGAMQAAATVSSPISGATCPVGALGTVGVAGSSCATARSIDTAGAVLLYLSQVQNAATSAAAAANR
jgi:hypothetical protein